MVSRKEKRGTHMYTRHHMWRFAVKVRAVNLASGPLEHLCELTDSEARIAFDKMTRYLKNKVPRGGGNVLEVGNGPKRAILMIWGWRVTMVVTVANFGSITI